MAFVDFEIVDCEIQSREDKYYPHHQVEEAWYQVSGEYGRDQ